jgi:hypothetical protein
VEVENPVVSKPGANFAFANRLALVRFLIRIQNGNSVISKPAKLVHQAEAQISAEARLLLSCVRCFAGTGGTGAIRDSVREIHDWDALMELARAHWIEPLVAWYLKTNCADLLDPGMLANQGAIVRRCMAHYLMLCVSLRKVLDLLAKHHIVVVPVKGPALSAMLCREIPWRESCDLDLLVRPADITGAKDALLAAGYRLDSDLPQGEEKAIFHWRSQLVLEHHGGGPAIDLHWQLLPSLFPAARHFDSAWQRVQCASFDNREILALSNEDQLFFLCAHAARHSWRSLRLAADVARLIHVCPRLDWDSLIRSSRVSDGATVLTLGLWVVTRVLEVKLPEAVRRYIDGEVGGKQFAHQLVEHLRTARMDGNAPVSEFGLQFKLASGWWPKMRCAAGYALLPTNADAEGLRLPQSLSFLYYPYRPLRLALKYSARWVKGGLPWP